MCFLLYRQPFCRFNNSMDQILVKYHHIDSQSTEKDGSTIDEGDPSSLTNDYVYESLSFLLQRDNTLTDGNKDGTKTIALAGCSGDQQFHSETTETGSEHGTLVEMRNVLADNETKYTNPLKRKAKMPTARESYAKRRSSLNYSGK